MLNIKKDGEAVDMLETLGTIEIGMALEEIAAVGASLAVAIEGAPGLGNMTLSIPVESISDIVKGAKVLWKEHFSGKYSSVINHTPETVEIEKRVSKEDPTVTIKEINLMLRANYNAKLRICPSVDFLK